MYIANMYRFRLYFKGLLAGVILFLSAIGSTATGKVSGSLAVEPLDLSGYQWLFKAGDNIAWAEKDFNAGSWQQVRLPDYAGRSADLLPGTIVWFRLIIPVSDLPKNNNLAIFLGRIKESDEIFLDGKLIGKTGSVAVRFRDYAGLGPAQVSRVYSLPAITASADTITIAIRVSASNYHAGLHRGPLLIGDSSSLLRKARKSDLPVWLRDGLWLTVLIVGFSISFASVYGAGRDNRNRWLPWFLGAAAITSLPHTIFAYELGWASPSLVQTLDFVPLIPLGMAHMAAGAQISIHRIQWFVGAQYYLVLAGCMILNPLMNVAMLVVSVSLILVLVVLLSVVVQMVFASRKSEKISRWTWFAIASALAGMAGNLFFDQYVPAALDPISVGGLFMTAGFLLAMSQHHRRDRQALVLMSRQLLNARDVETARIARELHDGVSQRLAVTRFRLEKLAKSNDPVKPESLQQPRDEIAETARDVAKIVETLRPVPASEQNFSDLVRQAVSRWGELAEPEISFRQSGAGNVPPETGEQLFRILQEAVHNALRHSGASKIAVNLKFTNQKGVLTIIDNGKGFDLTKVQNGVGLAAMGERSKVIEAGFSIEAAPGRGARIEVKFVTQ